jgi:hypothetical protein
VDTTTFCMAADIGSHHFVFHVGIANMISGRPMAPLGSRTWGLCAGPSASVWAAAGPHQPRWANGHPPAHAGSLAAGSPAVGVIFIKKTQTSSQCERAGGVLELKHSLPC